MHTCDKSVMKQQFFLTHTVCQIEIHALLHSWVTNALSVKTLCPQKVLKFWSIKEVSFLFCFL